ncbi:hypothetical protein [Solwaraspora sp. WMMA2065]|uniref:hypothetical protein n=1 Tax=Solwaraspora sp. WMMA2065 TaxID=3015166 RepID=UPI00259AFB19|nr:hypothetical protein [Solwaraspora sp. WMMA2065]WJK36719.1 hypothetical protein O7610_10415 [Solwaraspora sp. WMMA2065]
MGLAAIHISKAENFPAFFYGQNYMGTLEAYLAAPIFALFGPSVISLRIPNLLLFGSFLVIMWRLVDQLYRSRWFTLLIVGILALGSDRILKNQMISGGGYPEINPAGAGLMLLAVGLAADRYRHRGAAFAAWGFIAGLMIWVDPLVLPYILCAGAVLAIFTKKEIIWSGGALLAGGTLIGATPLIAHSISSRVNPISVLLTLSGSSEASPWMDHLYGGMIFGIPMGMGFCAPSECTPWQLWWGLAFPLLLLVAAIATLASIRHEEGIQKVTSVAHLGLLIGAALTILAYVRSSAAADTPVESARYLSCLLISLPAALWPLWESLQSRVVVWRVASATILAATAISTLVATAGVVAIAPNMRDLAQQRDNMIARLEQLGVTHVFSEYWTCNNITFATNESIVCAVIDEGDLSPGLNRYLPHLEAVQDSSDPAYVLPVDSPANPVVTRLLSTNQTSPAIVSVPGYHIYLPSS